MATKFFIGANEFQESAEQAQEVLRKMIAQYDLPEDLFVVVALDTFDS